MSDYDFNEPSGGRSRKQGMGCVFAGLLTGGLVFVLCCGGGTALVVFGMNMTTRDVEVQLRDNETLVEHIGPLQSFEFNWSASFAAEENIYVFDAVGKEGKGEITVETVIEPDDSEKVVWAELRTEDGELVTLVESN